MNENQDKKQYRDMQKITIKGRLGQKPKQEIINIKGEQRTVCNFSVACNDGYGGVNWYSVSVYHLGKIKYITNNFDKGDAVYLEGDLSIHKYQANDGTNNIRYTFRITMFSRDEIHSAGIPKSKIQQLNEEEYSEEVDNKEKIKSNNENFDDDEDDIDSIFDNE